MRSALAASIQQQRRTSQSQSYSVASASEASIIEDAARLHEPSAHHGKMRLSQAEECVEDSVLCIAVDGLHAVRERDKSVVFQTRYAGIKQIVWDHSDKAVHFVLADSSTSPVFLFPTLIEVEAHISIALANPELSVRPEELYLGVLVGKNIPSPIQQRRLSTASDASQQPVVLPTAKRREILMRERPPRTTGSSRERLGMAYFRNGNLRFQCSINGDMRGLQLDLQYLSVFPSPDSRDRSACLFMYPYEQIESCEANGQRLEIRFRRLGVSSKQPTYMAFKSYDAQYIRDAIWFFRTGDFIDAALRKKSNHAAPLTSVQSSEPKTARRESRNMSSRSSMRRHSTLTYFRDAETVQQRLDSRCHVIGCAKAVGTANESSIQESNSSCATIIGGKISSYNTTVASRDGMMTGFCEAHMALLGAPRSPSKRGMSLFKREKSRSSLSIANLVNSQHYARMIKFQGPLLKKNGSAKYQLTKAWNTKLAALFETPVGGFLCYYDKLAHCPGMADTPKERRVIDLSAVICIRSDSAAVRAPSIFAFDIVALYRNWTFATTDPQEYEIWIQVLAEAVEKHSSVAPDRSMTYSVKIIEQNASSGTRYESVLMEIGPHGVVVCTGLNAETEIHNWYFTEIQRWSVVSQHGETCCLLSCVSNGRDSVPATVDEAAASSSSSIRAVAPMYQNFLFQTPQAATICHVIEFYVSKCMAKLEVLSVEYVNNLVRKRSASGKLLRVQSEMPVRSAVPKLSPLKQHSTSAMVNDRQHVLEGVPLQPIGMTGDLQPIQKETTSQYDALCLANVASQPMSESVAIVSSSTLKPQPAPSHALNVPNDIPPTQQIDPSSSESLRVAGSYGLDFTSLSSHTDEELIKETQETPRVISTSLLEQIPREQLLPQVANAIAGGEENTDIEDIVIKVDDPQEAAQMSALSVQEEFTEVSLHDDVQVPSTSVILSPEVANDRNEDDEEAEQSALPQDVSFCKQEPVEMDSRDAQDAAQNAVYEETRTQSSPFNGDGPDSTDQERTSALMEADVTGDASDRFDAFVSDENDDQTDRSRVDSTWTEGTRSRMASETDEETYIMSSDSADDLYEDALDEIDCVDWDLSSSRESELELPCSPSQALEIAMLEALPSEELDEWDDVDLATGRALGHGRHEPSILLMKQAAPASPKRTAASTNGSTSSDAASKTRADHELPVLAKRVSPKRARKAISSSIQRDVTLPRVNSVTYSGSVAVTDSGEELEILKCILVREGYLQRLLHASTGGKVAGSHLGDTIDLLDLLRVASIDVVEAISSWRRRLQTQEPYRWNQLNYLLKMPSDLDFLQKHQALVQWLGFTLERNPFILPLNLDGCALQNDNRNDHRPRVNLRDDSSSFVQIGGKRQIELERPTTSQKVRDAAALAERKRAKNPYETRVLNDEELIPIASLAAPSTADSRSRLESTASRKTFLLPSQIGDMDMERIQSAEMIIIHEESVCGRYTRDIQGRVVPADKAQRQLDMIGLSGNAYRSSQPQSTQTLTRDESESPRSDSLLANPSALPGKSYAKKRAGMLGPIVKPMRRPARQPPGRRSRGAHLEEVLVQDRQATIQLGLRIDSLREEIERKDMDVAYFESFPGLQHYDNELSEFVRNARQETAQLRKDLHEKEYVYHHKMTNIDKKQEIIHVFKEKNKSAIEANYSAQIQAHVERVTLVNLSDIRDTFEQVSNRRRQELQVRKSNQEQQEREHLRTAPIVHSLCATLIQKIARGMIARAAFANMKIEFYVSSKYIQAAVRGFLTRRRVAKMFWQDAASRIIQRHTRGMIARRLVLAKRQCERVFRATITMQKVVRGHFGRIRMTKVQCLFHAREDLLQSVADLCAEDFKDLATECLAMVSIPSLTFVGPALPRKPLTSLVLGLVRILMLFTSDDDRHVDMATIRWREASCFLSCGMRLLRRMKQIAIAAEGRHLRHSPLGNLLVETYSADRAFRLDTFERLERCWKGASAIYKWVTAFATVTTLQSILPAYNLANEGPFMIEAETSAVEAKQDQTEEHENATTEEEIERRFVPVDLTHVASYPHHRRRPVVLLFAYDLPLEAKQRMLDSLLTMLPGLFIVLNRHVTNAAIARTKREKDNEWGWDFAALNRVITLGYSVVLECDIGLSDPQQRRFIGRFAAVKAAIKPSPLCILVRGSIKNRSAQAEDNLNSPQHASREQRVMADATIKSSFEQAADALFRLENDELTKQMRQLSSIETPPTAPMIIVMEAVIILLTPTKRYQGPRQSTSAVSWKLAKRLLSNPVFLLAKLHSIEHTEVTLENLTALDRYLKHQDWPSPAVVHSCGKFSRLLFALACWVQAMSSSAHLVKNCNGLACEITRTAPLSGLFGSVITFSNTRRSLGEHSEEDSALMELMEAVLLDVRVYCKSQPFDGRRYVVSVYHDCLHIYFSVYDPTSSFRWQSVIAEADVNRLLSPNSLERGDIRLPPKTKHEMYDRLVKLCILQDKPLNALASTSAYVKPRQPQALSSDHAVLFTKHLIVRPRAVRLYRRTLTLNGYFVTLTMAELSRGRIQVDTFVHNSSGTSPELRSTVNIESILERLSAQEAKDMFVALDKIPLMILDRLHLYRPMQSRLPRDKAVRSHAMLVDERVDMNLRIRSKPTSPGRCLLRTAVRSPWLAAIWMCGVYEHHVTHDYRIEFYQPQTCESFSIRLSRRDIQEFGRMTRLASCRPALFHRLVKRFVMQLDTDGRAIEKCRTRRIIARFPCAIPVAENAHQPVTKRRVVRARVQVERQVDAEGGSSEGRLCFCIAMPDTSEEQTLQLHDRELETCFSKISWATATTETRRDLSREFARTHLQWHSETGRVVARLPWGSMEATLSTRNADQSPSKKPTQKELQNRQSVGSLRRPVATVLPCTRLLDAYVAKPADGDESSGCYIYDAEKLIHNSSHRANGIAIITQVYMKAVVLETLVPRMPTDRIQQFDSFVMRLEIYEPKSSAHASVFINGRNDLREIVGPDHASLIASDQVHALLAYIFGSRTDVVVPQAGDPRDLSVTFLRDRLYAKQKATPINEHMKIDQTTNATKLIDQVEVRGVKVSSRVRSLPGFGAVIFTVFDLGVHDQRSPERSGMIRVDSYVRKTSARLSLVLDKTDLLLMVGEHVKLLEMPTALLGEDNMRIKMLAALVIDHCAIETLQDGSPDRLYLTDHFVPDQDDSKTKTDRLDSRVPDINQGQLLFKTLRTVDHDPVLVSVHSLEELESIEIRLYEPSTSACASLVLDKTTLALVFGLDESAFSLEELQLPKIPSAVVFSHALSLVRIEKTQRDPLCGEMESQHTTLLTGVLMLDQEQAVACRDRSRTHKGLLSEYSVHSQLLGSCQGMGVSDDRTYSVIRWDLFARPSDSQAGEPGPWIYDLLCSVYMPRLSSVETQAFGMTDLMDQFAEIPWLTTDSFQVAEQIQSRMHVYVAIQNQDQVRIKLQ